MTAQVFDADGFYRIGDAGFVVDPQRPEAGVAFNGRVAEDFKLSSRNCVSVGTLRLKVVSALAPWVQEAVIMGHDRDQVGMLLFPSAAAKDVVPADLAARTRTSLAAMRAERAAARRRHRCVHCGSPSPRMPMPARSPTRAASTRVQC